MFRKTILSIGIFCCITALSLMSCSNTSTRKAMDTPPAEKNAATAESKERITFDADSAMAYLKMQTDFGPRVPGSRAHALCADFLSASLKRFGATVTDTVVSTINPETGNAVPVRNIFAQFNPDAANRVLVLAHYDTRPHADMEIDVSKHSQPIDGANDGASGVAVGLELARHARALAPSRGLDILFVDMEDSGSYGNDDSWCLGSARWAAFDMPYTAGNMPRYAVLLDMVGGKDAVFMREYFSQNYAPAVNDLVWKAAADAGHSDRFVNRTGGAINDDHLSLLRAGIPTVDIIEMRVEEGSGGFNPTWHTLNDNFENIDPATIKAVGEVMTRLIYEN